MPESGHKLVTIHNGVQDVARAPRFNCDNHERVRLVMVARFGSPKDQIFLIKAVDLLKKTGDKVSFNFSR